jgi:hypothetical protein
MTDMAVAAVTSAPTSAGTTSAATAAMGTIDIGYQSEMFGVVGELRGSGHR